MTVLQRTQCRYTATNSCLSSEWSIKIRGKLEIEVAKPLYKLYGTVNTLVATINRAQVISNVCFKL